MRRHVRPIRHGPGRLGRQIDVGRLPEPPLLHAPLKLLPVRLRIQEVEVASPLVVLRVARDLEPLGDREGSGSDAIPVVEDGARLVPGVDVLGGTVVIPAHGGAPFLQGRQRDEGLERRPRCIRDLRGPAERGGGPARVEVVHPAAVTGPSRTRRGGRWATTPSTRSRRCRDRGRPRRPRSPPGSGPSSYRRRSARVGARRRAPPRRSAGRRDRARAEGRDQAPPASGRTRGGPLRRS